MDELDISKLKLMPDTIEDYIEMRRQYNLARLALLNMDTTDANEHVMNVRQKYLTQYYPVPEDNIPENLNIEELCILYKHMNGFVQFVVGYIDQ